MLGVLAKVSAVSAERRLWHEMTFILVITGTVDAGRKLNLSNLEGNQPRSFSSYHSATFERGFTRELGGAILFFKAKHYVPHDAKKVVYF